MQPRPINMSNLYQDSIYDYLSSEDKRIISKIEHIQIKADNLNKDIIALNNKLDKKCPFWRKLIYG